MAASNTGSNSTGRENYYNISYGMLSTNAKDAPEGYEEIALSHIKSERTKNENVDLRSKFYDTKNESKYPLRVFYTDISGVIESIEKDKYDKGITLKVTLHDSDGDSSILQTPFYGKVSADFLNRLLSVNPENELNFRPYSIPTQAEIGGGTVKFYNSGVSIKDAGVKTERAFKKDNGLPLTERVQNSQGEDETSRVKQVNFLWEKVEAKFAKINADSGTEAKKEAPAAEAKKPAAAKEPAEQHDDLPF